MRTGVRWTAGIALLMVVVLAVGAAYAHAIGDPENGGRLFVENCAVCHGVDGRGRVGANLTDFPGISISAALSDAMAGRSAHARAEWPGSPLSRMTLKTWRPHLVASQWDGAWRRCDVSTRASRQLPGSWTR
jgi:mono/diheme cytochrome c family protein